MKELIYDFYEYNTSIFYILNEFCTRHELQVPLLYISKAFDIENFAVYYIVAGIVLSCPCKQRFSIINSWIPSYAGMTPSAFYDFMIKLGISYACFGLFYAFLKFTINMPRPFCSLPPGSFATIIDISHERCLSSFPSSHTGLVVLIALNIWPYIGPRIRVSMLLLIGLVALSRIGLAMHYPADIIYSIFIAIFIYIISRLIYKLFENNLIKWAKGLLLGRLCDAKFPNETPSTFS